jgi:hypothetical protein
MSKGVIHELSLSMMKINRNFEDVGTLTSTKNFNQVVPPLGLLFNKEWGLLTICWHFQPGVRIVSYRV